MLQDIIVARVIWVSLWGQLRLNRKSTWRAPSCLKCLRMLNKLVWKSLLPTSMDGTKLGEAQPQEENSCLKPPEDTKVTFFFSCKYSCHANSTKGCITGSANLLGNFSFRACIFKVRKKILAYKQFNTLPHSILSQLVFPM